MRLILFSLLIFVSCSTPRVEFKRDLGFFTPSEYDKNLCQDPPSGMVCIPQLPKSKVPTFYIDKYEVTNRDYGTCVEAGICPKHKQSLSKDYIPFNSPLQPVVGTTYGMAHSYCTFVGKRLPTGDEWEILSEGTDKNLNCTTANLYSCNEKTLPVGSYPDRRGIYDIHGNAAEWVNLWSDECGDACNEMGCGKVCSQDNSVCSGKYPCQKITPEYLKIDWENLNLDGIRKSLVGQRLKLKQLRGGSYANSSLTIITDIEDTKHNPGFRCATDTNLLTPSPAWMITKPFPDRPLPPELTLEQKGILNSPVELDTISDKPLCKSLYTSPANCRDPVSYTKPNEARNILFSKYIKNLGGGYVGVAADANYTFLTYAKSEFVWLMDFNINIVNLHRINRVFILNSPTPREFLEKWNPSQRANTLKLLEQELGQSPEWKNIKNFFEVNQAGMFEHYRTISIPDRTNPDFGWLRSTINYEYLRLLHQQGRILILEGDLLKDKSLLSIGNMAKKLKVKIRIFYPSNAEEFWKFTPTFKKNILNLPFDEASVVLRTVHEFPWQKNELSGGVSGFWHYVVHGAYNYQKKLLRPDFYLIDHFKEYRVFPGNLKDFSTIEVPTSLPVLLKN